MSDKSVTKVLDWPNHRHGSKISDPIRFEEGVESDEGWCWCDQGDHLYVEGHSGKHQFAPDALDEQEPFQQQQEPVGGGPGMLTQDQQLDPTTQQNMSPYGQGQFVPSSSMYGPMAPQKEELGHCDTHNKNFADHDDEELEEDIDDGLLDTLGETPEGMEKEQGEVDCPYCSEHFPSEASLENHITEEHPDAEPESSAYAPKRRRYLPEEEAVRDPRPDPTGKDKEKDKELSPEAQKIAGTDPKSVAAKEKAKPKLEVEVSDKITVLGKTGSGKTNLIKVLLSDILPDFKFVVLDALGNMAEYDGKPNIEYHQTNPTDTEEVDQIIYSALEQGNCMVVIDEVDRYQSKKGTMLNELVNVGRNYGVGGLFAARRTADVDKDILANSPFIFVYQHILPQDLDVLIDWFAQPEETFRDLQEFEAILFKDGTEVWQGKVPEKPTTAPTKKPIPPKKPKGSKGKDKDKEKGTEPTPTGGEGGEPEPEDAKDKGTPKKPMGPEAPPEEEPVSEEKKESKSDDCMPGCKNPDCDTENAFCSCGDCEVCSGEDWVPEKDEARYDPNAPFKCSICEQGFKYERDFETHLLEKHGSM